MSVLLRSVFLVLLFETRSALGVFRCDVSFYVLILSLHETKKF